MVNKITKNKNIFDDNSKLALSLFYETVAFKCVI